MWWVHVGHDPASWSGRSPRSCSWWTRGSEAWVQVKALPSGVWRRFCGTCAGWENRRHNLGCELYLFQMIFTTVWDILYARLCLGPMSVTGIFLSWTWICRHQNWAWNLSLLLDHHWVPKKQLKTLVLREGLKLQIASIPWGQAVLMVLAVVGIEKFYVLPLCKSSLSHKVSTQVFSEIGQVAECHCSALDVLQISLLDHLWGHMNEITYSNYYSLSTVSLGGIAAWYDSPIQSHLRNWSQSWTSCSLSR